MKTYFSFVLIGYLMMGQHSIALSQEDPLGKLYIGNTISGNAVLLKWAEPELGSKEGFLIYRQKEGETAWNLLNAKPVKKLAALEIEPQDRNDAIAYLEGYIEKNDLSKADPFTLLLLCREMVELDAFAKYLGLFYQDETVQKNQSYRYKVTKLEKGKDKLVGLSETILIKPFEPIDPPQGIKVYLDEKMDTLVKIFWTPEETRYFSVNIYRALKGEESKKLNNNPAMPTLLTNVGGELAYPDVFYDRSDHIIGKTYIYELKGMDFFGRESKISPPFEIEIIDRRPPPPPTDLQAVRTGPRDVRVTLSIF